MTPDEAHAYLLSLPRFDQVGASAYKPGLDRIQALLEGMGRPQDDYPVVHVAGTNGKGSTCSMIASILTAAGKRVGLHTSPHLFTYGERMRINGQPASEAWLASTTARWAGLFETVRPTFFEAAVGLSLLHFSEMNVDIAVVEVGLGGRLDATNIIMPVLCAITSIGMDHQEFLGNSLSDIAAEKAGIVKYRVPLVTSATQPEVLHVLASRAAACDSSFHAVCKETKDLKAHSSLNLLEIEHVETPVRTYRNITVDLPGMHQAANALLAVRAVEILPDILIEKDSIHKGLTNVKHYAGLRGRFDVLTQEPLIILDVAHNSDGLNATVGLVRTFSRDHRRSLYVVFGAMRDKDVHGMLAILKDAGATVLPVAPPSERALCLPEIELLLKEYQIPIVPASNVAGAVSWFERNAAQDDILLITGSHLVAAQVPGRLLKRP